jgi:hypothetical protein
MMLDRRNLKDSKMGSWFMKLSVITWMFVTLLLGCLNSAQAYRCGYDEYTEMQASAGTELLMPDLFLYNEALEANRALELLNDNLEIEIRKEKLAAFRASRAKNSQPAASNIREQPQGGERQSRRRHGQSSEIPISANEADLQARALPKLHSLSATRDTAVQALTAELGHRLDSMPINNEDVWRLIASGEILGRFEHCLNWQPNGFMGFKYKRGEFDRLKAPFEKAMSDLRNSVTAALTKRKELFSKININLSKLDLRVVHKIRWAMNLGSKYTDAGLADVGFKQAFWQAYENRREEIAEMDREDDQEVESWVNQQRNQEAADVGKVLVLIMALSGMIESSPCNDPEQRKYNHNCGN